MLPQFLLEIQNFLQKNELVLESKTRDGRINSALNEDNLVNLISSQFDIIYPKKRDWFDFAFEIGGVFYPVNIKITKLSTDNLNCKLGIYYALTGKIPHFDNEVRWKALFEALKQNLEPNSKDYYFLIINKENTKDIFSTSLKQLFVLTPNGNNPPFQANWAKNRILVERDFEKAKDFLLSAISASFGLRAKAYSEFLEFFPEFKGQND